MINTVSLETAKLLKEKEFRQDTELFFCEGNTYTEYEVICGTFGIINKETLDKTLVACYEVHPLRTLQYYASPCTDELIAELPPWIIKCSVQDDLSICSCRDGWSIIYGISCGDRETCHEEVNESLPESLAQMWLYLKSEGLIEGK